MNRSVPSLPSRPRRVTAIRAETVRAARATLEAVHEKLDARGYNPKLSAAKHILWVDGACVARVLRGKLFVSSVEDGINPALTVSPSESYAPTAERDGIAKIALAVELRVHIRREQRVRFAAWNAERLEGHVCPGSTCRQPLCEQHSRPASHDCAEDNQGVCHICGELFNMDRAEEVSNAA